MIRRAVFALIGSNAAVLAARSAHEDWGEPPPFWFVRLFVEKSRKDRQEPHAGSNHSAAPLSLTLSSAVTLDVVNLDLVTLDAMAR
jgi:hypothetical protein